MGWSLCRLGHAPGPPYHQVHQQPRPQSRNGPSRQRRRERRAEERNQLEAEEASKVETEKLMLRIKVILWKQRKNKESVKLLKKYLLTK